uniref:Obtusifoliol 14-alpha demethylase n=2 Tax=Aegilops tauschii TaxID=37682 RepID=A0A453JFP7_AEGTS
IRKKSWAAAVLSYFSFWRCIQGKLYILAFWLLIIGMNMTAGWAAVWFTAGLVFITVIVLRIIRGTSIVAPTSGKPPPPVVNGLAFLGLLPRLLTIDLPAKINCLYSKYGSVFTVSPFGLCNVTFLIGPEVQAHFFQGLESEINHGNLLEFLVPMFGQEVGQGVDAATRTEQSRFYLDALKQSKLRRHLESMLQEVEGYFGKWGQEGIVDLKHEFEELLMLISSRCLLGKEVREKMFDEFYKLFRDVENGVNMISVFFPYIPIPANRRRDKARLKLIELLSETVRSRKSSVGAEEDVLQRLIDSKYKDGRSTTETEVTGMIIALIFGGKHTSSLACTWTGASLLTHSKFLAAASQEQKEIMMKYNNKIEYDALLEMNNLHSCIKEALRINPPTTMLVRKALKHFTVRTRQGQEYDIPKGHTLASPIIQNNNMPYIYKNPHLYDPDRFGPARQEDVVGGKFSYTSFGGGRHFCSGDAYAYMQVKVIWSHLLNNFDLKLLSPYPKTDWSKLIPEPKGSMIVSYKRRPLLG